VDVLLPLEPNRCAPSAKDSCSEGWAACEDGQRVCHAPPPGPEVVDGLDNDCNGTVDDVPSASVRPRALVLVPDYLWTEAPEELSTVQMIFDQWGIPFDITHDAAQWDAAFGVLSSYALVFFPGYLPGWPLAGTPRAALERFASDGGVVVVSKPITDESGDVLALAGLSDGAQRPDALAMQIDPRAPAFAAFDSPEELRIRLTDDPTQAPVDTIALEPRAGTEVLATMQTVRGDAPAIITRRALGLGAVYAIGHDLHAFSYYRCYINCFEPAGDLLGLMLREALREGARGHVVLKHTVPGVEDTAVALSHDIDAPDSHNAGSWGEPGAIQMARVEQEFGARGQYFVTTDYVTGYYNQDTVRSLCDLGMCPVGAHSVRHHPTFSEMPKGTCAETAATYDAANGMTVCGEVRVAQELLSQITGQPVRAWRSPFLYVPPDLYDILDAQGFLADSSYAIGDLKTNLPVSLARTGYNQELFRHRPLYTFPIALEDGRDVLENGEHHREEIQSKNFELFMTLWSYGLLRNADNHGYSVVLIHPSWGQGVGPENLPNKMRGARRLLETASRRGAVLENIEDLAVFWRAREQVELDAYYETTTGYSGTLRTGELPVSNLTLEFGDTPTVFACPDCGEYQIAARRVVLRGPLAAGTTYAFTARP
jgi:hypothetical protein